MPLWLIERDMTGWSREQRDAAGIQAKMCVLWYQEMSWLRSYFNEETGWMTCIYAARSAEDIRAHARAAGIPCNAIHPVDEVLPEQVEDPPQAPASV